MVRNHPVDNHTDCRKLPFGKDEPALNLQALVRLRVRVRLPQREGYAAMNYRAYIAEAIGTFWLTFGGCGSAVIAAGFPQVGIGLLGVSLAFASPW
jgi:hypothetical protein